MECKYCGAPTEEESQDTCQYCGSFFNSIGITHEGDSFQISIEKEEIDVTMISDVRKVYRSGKARSMFKGYIGDMLIEGELINPVLTRQSDKLRLKG